MSKQFSHTTLERRSSLIYSASVGKAGLYVPQDYLPVEVEEQCAVAEEDADSGDDDARQERSALIAGHGRSPGSETPQDINSLLLDANNSRSLQHESQQTYQSFDSQALRRKYSRSAPNIHRLSNTIDRELLDEERDLLLDNKLLSSEQLHCTSHHVDNENSGLQSSSRGSVKSADHSPDSECSEQIITAWEEAIESGKQISTSYRREISVINYNAFPLVFTFVLQNSLSLASIFTVSHLGTKELGGVTLGSMTANITGIAAIQGLCTCLDTLCSQAYGAQNYHLVGVLVQRCAIITILAFLPVMYIWWGWSETVLSWMIPEQELCKLAANYLKVTAFGVPGFVIFECGKRFLQCQGIFYASTIVLFICAPLNAIMNYLLVWNKTFGIGYLGAPLSVAINYWLMALGLIFFTLTTKHEIYPMKCWNGFIKPEKIFCNWKKMFNLALPGIIMVEAEFLGFEILTIFSSHLGTAPLAAQSIISTIAALAYQLPFSISVATSTRVANFIGASLHRNCILTCKVSLMLSFACSSINMLIIFGFKSGIAKLFTKEKPVVDLIIETLPYLGIMQIFDAFNASTAGCLRGQGRQKIGGYINLFAFYCVGIPLASILTFRYDYGIRGLWIGITCALAAMSCAQGFAVFHGDWNKIMHAARARNAESATA